MCRKKQTLSFIILLLATGIFAFAGITQCNNYFVSYITSTQDANIKLYWKNDSGKPLKTLQALKAFTAAKGQTLLFAMNGGMYKTDNSPLGLYIENNKTLAPINKRNATGNFYLQPNGIFYITINNLAGICTTGNFVDDSNIKYATQSGPMLVINGNIQPAFKQGAANINIRNGVGILPGNKILFAMSKEKINLYDFASYFKNAGCSNALYLDGFVSRTYLPAQNWMQTDGDFGVMIGVTVRR